MSNTNLSTETSNVPSTSASPVIPLILNCELTSPTPSISPGPISPAPSSLPDIRKKRSRSIESRESQEAKRRNFKDTFETVVSQLTKSRSEEQIFCNFLQSRLEKLNKKYYIRFTHTVIQELMKIELEQSEDMQ